LQISDYQIKRLLKIDNVEGEVDKTLGAISDTVIYLSDTIDDFQTYFHPDKQSMKIESFELLQKVINFSLPRVKESSINLTVDRVDETYLSTYVNELIQVLLNLVNNAIDSLNKKTPDDAQVTLSLIDKGEVVEISIQDNGGGIDEVNLPRIFEPYFSTKGKNGTGLGLYMSQMIAQKQLGGKIDVKTSSDGATFTVTIPKTA